VVEDTRACAAIVWLTDSISTLEVHCTLASALIVPLRTTRAPRTTQHAWPKRARTSGGMGFHCSVAISNGHASRTIPFMLYPPLITRPSRVPSHSLAPSRDALHTPTPSAATLRRSRCAGQQEPRSRRGRGRAGRPRQWARCRGWGHWLSCGCYLLEGSTTIVYTVVWRNSLV